MNDRISLIEQVLLLYLDEQSGRLQGPYRQLLLVAAGVTDLALQGQVRVTENAIFLLDGNPTDHPGLNLLRDALSKATLGVSLRALSTQHDVSAQLERLTAEKLRTRGIWASEDKRFLFLRYTIYAMIRPEIKQQVVSNLQNTLESRATPKESSAVLLGILGAINRLDAVFTRHEQKIFAPRVRDIVNGSILASRLYAQIEKVRAEDDNAAATAAIIAASSS